MGLFLSISGVIGGGSGKVFESIASYVQFKDGKFNKSEGTTDFGQME